MGVCSKVVCHTSVTKYSEDFGIEIKYEEGYLYEAVVLGEDTVDVYDYLDDKYCPMTAHEFFCNFSTISHAENETTFLNLLCPKAIDVTTNYNNKINELLILKKWQTKQNHKRQ